MTETEPTQRCTVLAEQLADMARQELDPRLRPLLPDARKAAVRAYWLAQMTDLGVLGQGMVESWRKAG